MAVETQATTIGSSQHDVGHALKRSCHCQWHHLAPMEGSIVAIGSGAEGTRPAEPSVSSAAAEN
jgi:hypothetical protein